MQDLLAAFTTIFSSCIFFLYSTLSALNEWKVLTLLDRRITRKLWGSPPFSDFFIGQELIDSVWLIFNFLVHVEFPFYLTLDIGERVCWRIEQSCGMRVNGPLACGVWFVFLRDDRGVRLHSLNMDRLFDVALVASANFKPFLRHVNFHWHLV